jgi:hypothetical protein
MSRSTYSLPRGHTYNDLISFRFKNMLNEPHTGTEQKITTTFFDVLPCLPQILTHTSLQEPQQECTQAQFTVPDNAHTDEQTLIVLCS